MLNLHRLAPGAESYYLDQVVSGIEEYYAEAGEAPGYWLASSRQLGLSGTVQPEELRAVLTGRDPRGGRPLHRAKNRKVPGWDLTFRAPKSVSVLWGLGEPEIASQVVEAHEAAVARAMAYMEKTSAYTRTGHNGIHRVETAGFIAAGFRHRTSRDRDPLLHTHVLVANSVCAADGRWRTIDATALYEHAKTSGYIYQAQLRHELTGRLGVSWKPIHDGLADIDGIDQDLIDLFSKRREQIEQTMAECISVETVEHLTSDYLQRPDVVPVGWRERTGTTFSTTELMQLEQDLVDLVENELTAGVAVAQPIALAASLEHRPSLSAEQAAVVAEMCTSGRGVEVLVAAAGTGKTFALDAARDAWRRSGNRVIGCALSAAAAQEMQGGSGIPSNTIAMLEVYLRRGREQLDARTVLVVDEAGTVGTRKLAPLLRTAANSGTKVVLVGDPKQLPEIDAGGLLGALAQRNPVLTLAHNRRQTDAVERRALEHLRDGDVAAAVGMLREHDDVKSGPNAETVRNAMVGDWWQHRTNGANALMMAKRHTDVDDLNRRARRHLADAGQLHGEPLVVNERPFQIGDHVLCTRNDYSNAIRNGTTGEIVDIDHRHRSMTIATDTGERKLSGTYLDDGHLRHGYAITVHKAQGRTCDHGLLLASDDLYREMGYVGLSRGRQSNRMYAVSDEPADELEHHGAPRDQRADPLDLVVESMHRSAAKELAIDQADASAGVDDDLDLGW